MKTTGLVYVFTGEGKGKTSAAIGTAVRAAGNGMKVAWVGFYKQPSWKLSEIGVFDKLGIKVFLMGKGFYLKDKSKPATVSDTATKAEHKTAAKLALTKAKELMGEVEVLVLDEVNNSLQDKLIDLIDLIDLINLRKQTHLILTGRGAMPEIVKLADLVTEMKKIKHPYDAGKLAVRGLDF